MQTTPKHILAIRFSALGDIAMIVPVLKNVLAQNPALQITFVSTNFVKPFFENIDRLHFVGINLKLYNGIFGLYKLSKFLKKNIAFDAIADLHNVLRTKIIRQFCASKNTAVLDKGRKEKQALTRAKNKVFISLKPMVERYADVFRKIHCTVILNEKIGFSYLQPKIELLPFKKAGNEKLIGIAPFAKHNAKMYPIKKMENVVQLLLMNASNKLFLFAAANELELLGSEFLNQPNFYIITGKYSFADELNIISQLDVMVSMDSANMHLASLYNVPVVSIWGGTHAYAGFGGWAQSNTNMVQINMPCRPSSVFGNKLCPVHGAAGCMQNITPAMVVEKVQQVLG
ncbi:MAG: glycosyltransferase family 9 protein [Ferruginibacter sp.]|nr:glycosyltransferase family 9 protein [Ferruginibacter sp.]